MMALKAGINPSKIVFSGVGKTTSEISFAIDKKILLINAESLSEIKEINRIAKSKNKRIKIGVRLNPNTDAKTLSQISTGKKENKFGVNKNTFYEIINYCKNSKNIDLKCLSVHIGSQILDHRPYEKMLKAVSQILNKTNHKFEFIDLGGGMGITYTDKNKKLDLMRPALYGAFHKTLPVTKSNKTSKKPYEFVGPICESTDKFVTLKKFQVLNEKDLIAICDVGAYGMSLSSNYNLRPKPIELLIKGSKIKVIRKRQKHKDII